MTKKSRSKYINTVRKGIAFYETMAALKDKETFNFKYDDKTYEINCSIFRDSPSYSISDGEIFGRHMNVDMEKSTKSFLLLYTYDLFVQRSTYKINFKDIKIIK